jgi:hypothetical protein
VLGLVVVPLLGVPPPAPGLVPPVVPPPPPPLVVEPEGLDAGVPPDEACGEFEELVDGDFARSFIGLNGFFSLALNASR